jgi:hypothetical protein
LLLPQFSPSETVACSLRKATEIEEENKMKIYFGQRWKTVIPRKLEVQQPGLGTSSFAAPSIQSIRNSGLLVEEGHRNRGRKQNENIF